MSLPKFKVNLKPQSSPDLVEKYKEVLSLLTNKNVDGAITLLDDIFAKIEQFPMISKQDFCSLLESRCKATLLKSDQLTEKEDKKLILLKALNNGQECVINQPVFANGYIMYANAFIKFAKLVDADLTIQDQGERSFMKQVLGIGKGVIDSLKSGLEIGEISRKEKQDIHTSIANCLSCMYWNTIDLVKGEEEPEEVSFEEMSKQMFARQNLIFSGGLKLLDKKGEEYVAKITSSSETHLESKMYTLIIQVLDFRPLIWRRFKVPGSITLASLQDRVITPIMGWCRNYHAYYFRKAPFEKNNRKLPIGIPEPNFVFGPIYSQAVDKVHEYSHNVHTMDDTKIKLFQMLEKVGDEMLYVYDLGDGWRHKIYVENIEDSGDQPITVEDGENCCPPEDCGSIRDYVNVIQGLLYGSAFKNNPVFAKDKSSYSELLTHANRSANYSERKGSFDPLYFSLVEAKRHLQNGVRSNISKLDDSNFVHFNFQTGSTKVGQFEETKLLSNKPIKSCAICQSSANLKQCSTCRSVYYCSREHQLKDWPNHKKVCGKEKK